MTDMMQAVEVTENGSLVMGQAPRPRPGPNDVLVEVRAAGLNRADLIQRKGAYPPPPGASEILGLELAGTIAGLGEQVSGWKVGDRVAGLVAGGGYAEYALVDEGSLLAIPAQMGFTEACCFPEALFTVWANVFERAGLKSGEAFLCHGGTSGIGVMALQMAKLAGAAPIFATAGSAEKCALMQKLGADHAINYRDEDFVDIVKAGGGADVILDMVGGDYVQRNISAARLNGRIVNIAYQNGFRTEVNFAPVLMKRLSLNATTLRARPNADKRAIRDALLAKVWPNVESGQIIPVIDRVFAMKDAESAHAHMAQGGHSGKIILER